jgi:hypothetical protein
MHGRIGGRGINRLPQGILPDSGRDFVAVYYAYTLFMHNTEKHLNFVSSLVRLGYFVNV